MAGSFSTSRLSFYGGERFYERRTFAEPQEFL
jgi:hypothetical protein